MPARRGPRRFMVAKRAASPARMPTRPEMTVGVMCEALKRAPAAGDEKHRRQHEKHHGHADAHKAHRAERGRRDWRR